MVRLLASRSASKMAKMLAGHLVPKMACHSAVQMEKMTAGLSAKSKWMGSLMARKIVKVEWK